MLEQMMLRDHEDSENSLKRKTQCIVCSTKERKQRARRVMHQMQQGAAWRMLL
jgi:hypothetical protein